MYVNKTSSEDAQSPQEQEDNDDKDNNDNKVFVLPATFVLKMNWKVGSQKMANAIAESVGSRCSSQEDVQQLKSVLSAGDYSAKKGTVFQFDCQKQDGIRISVNGKQVTKELVGSSELSEAFCKTYMDDNTVSPTLKQSCLEGMKIHQKRK